jgi:hypothetical protein
MHYFVGIGTDSVQNDLHIISVFSSMLSSSLDILYIYATNYIVIVQLYITTNVASSNPVVLDTTLCDKVCQWLVTDRWFSPGTPVSSTNKTDRHDITEISMKVVLNTINLIKSITNLLYIKLMTVQLKYKEIL